MILKILEKFIKLYMILNNTVFILVEFQTY